MALLELKNVSLIYHSHDGETEAVSDVSLTVGEGEFVSVVGPSGCGKTTLLGVIAGLIAPSGGEVLIKGRPVSEARNMTSLMPQRDQLFEWRSVFRNVTLGPEIKRDNSTEMCADAVALL